MDMGSSDCISVEAISYQGLDSGFYKGAHSRVNKHSPQTLNP